MLLKLRADDYLELRKWLNRPEKQKSLSPEIENEILQDFAHATLRKLCESIRESQFYSLMADETTDMPAKEQVSICIRRVNEKFKIDELFMGFYQTENIKSTTLLNCLMDVLCRFSLLIQNCRGQCFDGSSNMSGSIYGLQTLMRGKEERAIYVHCRAHNFNLVAQDSVENQIEIRNIVQSFIAFARGSPKRLACFNKFRNVEDVESGTSLRPFCPTRWILRKPSIISITSNYSAIINWLEDFENHSDNSAKNKSEAAGYLESFCKFDTFFKLEILRMIFTIIEDANTALQGKYCFT